VANDDDATELGRRLACLILDLSDSSQRDERESDDIAKLTDLLMTLTGLQDVCLPRSPRRPTVAPAKVSRLLGTLWKKTHLPKLVSWRTVVVALWNNAVIFSDGYR
jgi:hypothetical protein